MKSIRLTVIWLGLTALVGCTWPALREYNYKGQLPSHVEADLALATRFAEDLSAHATVRTRRHEYPQGSLLSPGDTGVQLVTEGNPRVVTCIFTYKETHSLRVLIYGDIDSPIAKAFAASAQELFAKDFPGYKLAPFTRRETLIGP